MSREKHNKKKHRTDSAKENKNKDDRSKSQLFSDADAKSVEISGYTMGYGAPQTDQSMQERTIPTGVVEVDESVQLPPSPSQHHDSKSYTTLRSSQDQSKEHVHLPPITRHQYPHQPYGYYHTPPDYDYFGHYSHPYPVHHEYQSPHHHHHHHHHRRHRHHKHVKEVETYDPRWWYMPLNSVHGPRPWKPPEYHYAAPKCTNYLIDRVRFRWILENQYYLLENTSIAGVKYVDHRKRDPTVLNGLSMNNSYSTVDY